MGWQTIVLAFVLLDIAGLGFTLVAPVWLVPWMTMNATALVLGTLSWSEHRRLQRESAAARERQAEKVREAQRRYLEERQREALRQQEAERHRQAEQLREAERRRQEEKEREAQRQQEAERLRQAEQLREAEWRRQEEKEREAQRQQEVERLRQAEQLREAERRRWQAEELRRQAEELRRQAEEECEAHRQHQREREWATAPSQTQWWRVLDVESSAGKDEIVLNYRRKIKQYHPDRLAGLAPELLELAEERTKALNAAYEQALGGRR